MKKILAILWKPLCSNTIVYNMTTFLAKERPKRDNMTGQNSVQPRTSTTVRHTPYTTSMRTSTCLTTFKN